MNIRQNEPVKALFWMILSAVGFSGMSATVKILGNNVPEFQSVFARACINFFIALFLVIHSKEKLFPKKPTILYFRSFVGFIGVVCLFFAIKRLPLSIATLLSSSAPLFVLIFSEWFLSEKISKRHYIWIVGAFSGIFILVNPDTNHVSSTPVIPFIVGLVGAAAGGLAYLSVRKATETYGVNIIVLYFAGFSALMSLPFSKVISVPPSSKNLGFLVLLGVFGSLGQFAMTRAYFYAQAGVVSVFGLMSPILSCTYGVLFFHEKLIARQWSGVILLVISIIMISLKPKH